MTAFKGRFKELKVFKLFLKHGEVNGVTNNFFDDNRVMKALMDVEAIHTYEGTYEVNMLVSGREITGGLNAFKK